MPEQFLFYQREAFIIQCEGLDEATGEKKVHYAMETKIEIGICSKGGLQWGFWIFMLIMDLLLPFTMIGFGRYFMKKGSKGNKFSIWISDFDVYEEQRHMGICS